MIQGVKITQSEFTTIEAKITKLLKPLKEFTSPTYQRSGIETNDGLFILIKPKQQLFVDALKPLKINWIEIQKSVIKQPEEV